MLLLINILTCECTLLPATWSSVACSRFTRGTVRCCCLRCDAGTDRILESGLNFHKVYIYCSHHAFYVGLLKFVATQGGKGTDTAELISSTSAANAFIKANNLGSSVTTVRRMRCYAIYIKLYSERERETFDVRRSTCLL